MATPVQNALRNVAKRYDLHPHTNLIMNGFLSTQGVLNFLNVPYATIPARFRESQLLDLQAVKGKLNCTEYGPRCPQPPDELHDIMFHMVERLGRFQPESEMDCLHLNVYCPPLDMSDRQLPILVYIHGGAWNFGDNSTEFNGNHLVMKSMKIDKPCIVITLNYRLNVFGFLMSKELIQEAKDLGETPVLNLGLNDQTLALEWIHKHAALFGGDAANITLAGDSAGSMSVAFQIKTRRDCPFKRAIMLSGPPVPFRRLKHAQDKFDRMVEALGLQADSPYQTKLAALRSLSPAALLHTWDNGLAAPIYDRENMAPAEVDVRSLKSTYRYYWDTPAWLESMIIGYTADEAALFGIRSWKTFDWAQAGRVIEKAMPNPVLRSHVLESSMYRHASSPFHALVNVCSDAFFIRPSLKMAMSIKVPVVLSVLEAKDPYDYELHGFSWHCLAPSLFFNLPACQSKLPVSTHEMTSWYLAFIAGEHSRSNLETGLPQITAFSEDGRSQRPIDVDGGLSFRGCEPALEEEYIASGHTLIRLAMSEQSVPPTFAIT